MIDRLATVVVADPVESTAELIGRSCGRFADRWIAVTSGERLLRTTMDVRPQLVVLSLDLRDPSALDVIPVLQRQSQKAALVVTFGDLSFSQMQRLMSLGVEDLLPQPVDPAALARLAWTRFSISSRAHVRYDVTLDVRQGPGALLGRTTNLSEGGMMLSEVTKPLTRGLTLPADLMLPNEEPLRVHGAILAAEGQVPSPMWARFRFEPLFGKDRQRLLAFLSRLAREREPRISVVTPPEIVAPGEKPVVFVVDDEPDTLALWTRALRSTYDIVTFEDPRKALAAAQSTTPALLITDHHMPGLTGVELARKLEEAGVSCPTIMVTAFPEAVDEIEARERFFNVVPKPVKPEDLVSYSKIAISSFRLKAATRRLAKIGGPLPRRPGGTG